MKELKASAIKTILCTIDFSDSTNQSIEWGIAMARQLGAHLTLLYTYRLIQSDSDELMKLKRNKEEDARKNFAKLEKQYLLGNEISYDFQIEIGFVSDRIEDHAKKNNLNFVVMDKNFKAKNHETLEELIEHIHVPMLLVP